MKANLGPESAATVAGNAHLRQPDRRSGCHKGEAALRAGVLVVGLLSLLACSGGLAGAGGSGKSGGMSDSIFVEVMYELINARNQPGGDTAVFAGQRREVLSKYGFTKEDLEKKSEVLAQDAVHAADVWGKLRRKYSPSVLGKQER